MINTKLKRIILTALMGAVAVLFSGCSKEEVYRLVKVNSFEGEVSVQREEKLDAFEGLQLVSEDSVSVGEVLQTVTSISPQRKTQDLLSIQPEIRKAEVSLLSFYTERRSFLSIISLTILRVLMLIRQTLLLA